MEFAIMRVIEGRWSSCTSRQKGQCSEELPNPQMRPLASVEPAGDAFYLSIQHVRRSEPLHSCLHFLLHKFSLSILIVLNIGDVLSNNLRCLVTTLYTKIPTMRLWPNQHEEEVVRKDLYLVRYKSAALA